MVAEGGKPAAGRPAADGDHEGVAGHRVVAVSRLVPGDHPGAHRRGDPRKSDSLIGLKENVIIGKLIPAGTGLERYRNVRVEPTEEARANAYTVSGYDVYYDDFGNTGDSRSSPSTTSPSGATTTADTRRAPPVRAEPVPSCTARGRCASLHSAAGL